MILEFTLNSQIDNKIEVAHYKHGGILPCVITSVVGLGGMGK
jgi:hypothetical protein